MILCFCGCIFSGFSQEKKVQVNPFIDQRLFHLGFMVGLNMQDLEFTHGGYVADNGQTWFAEIPSFSPGFSVGIVGEMYLHKNFSLRTIPSLHFGERRVVFRESNTGEEEKFEVKSNYLMFPFDLKISSDRINNYRPYLLAGIAPTFDLSKKNQSPVQMKPLDFYLEFGFGCDFYFPYFKFIPEIKFCLGLSDVLNHEPNILDQSLLKYTNSISKATSRMIVITFNFE